MKYTFNYKEYSKRYYDLVGGEECYGDIFEGIVSNKLQYYSLKNNNKEFLLPSRVVCFGFGITNEYKQKAREILISKGFEHLEIIGSFAQSVDSPVCVDLKNGNILLFNTCFGDHEPQFINSTIEQFAECSLFYEEFRNEERLNADKDNGEFDWITEDIVLDIFSKIEKVDSEAVKVENFWHGFISIEIMCNEGHKMVEQGRIPNVNGSVTIPFNVENIPSVLDLPAWKLLHP